MNIDVNEWWFVDLIREADGSNTLVKKHKVTGEIHKQHNARVLLTTSDDPEPKMTREPK